MVGFVVTCLDDGVNGYDVDGVVVLTSVVLWMMVRSATAALFFKCGDC